MTSFLDSASTSVDPTANPPASIAIRSALRQKSPRVAPVTQASTARALHFSGTEDDGFAGNVRRTRTESISNAPQQRRLHALEHHASFVTEPVANTNYGSQQLAKTDSDRSVPVAQLSPAARLDRLSVSKEPQANFVEGGFRRSKSSSVSSLSALVGLNRKIMKEMFEDRQTSSVCLLLKMLAVVGIPAVTLIVMSGVMLSTAVRTQVDSRTAIAALTQFLAVDDLVTSLQLERGMTATYLSSNGSNTVAYARMLSLRNGTDKSLAGLGTAWPPHGLVINEETFATKQSFVDYLARYRKIFDQVAMPFEQEARWYTDINLALMWWSQSTVQVPPSSGSLWQSVVALGAKLRASDDIGLQRALGSAFFTFCSLPNDSFDWFWQEVGRGDAMLKTAFSLHEKSQSRYTTAYVGSVVQSTIEAKRSLISSVKYREVCRNLSAATRFANSADWFNNVTSYINSLKSIRTLLAAETVESLNRLVNVDLANEVISYSVVLAAVIFLSLVLSMWHSHRMRSLIKRLSTESYRMASKSQEVSTERRRVDRLLNQLMPRSIVEQMKTGGEAQAEYFDMVTVYFSDIVGFTTISAMSTAMQIVSMLNNLFSIFDEQIDLFDVYKVATIGDAYLVVGGAPERASDHAYQICRLAVGIRRSVADFTIAHLPQHKFQQRVGLHSGPVVAGVVGTRSPRYLIFGKTVLVANKLESTGRRRSNASMESSRSPQL